MRGLITYQENKESRIQATEMKVLKIIKGVTRRDRIRNVHTREELVVQDILKFIGRGQLKNGREQISQKIL